MQKRLILVPIQDIGISYLSNSNTQYFFQVFPMVKIIESIVQYLNDIQDPSMDYNIWDLISEDIQEKLTEQLNEELVNFLLEDILTQIYSNAEKHIGIKDFFIINGNTNFYLLYDDTIGIEVYV